MSTARGPLACLLLVRDVATELPSYLASVERFADMLVVMDAGSTDGTRSILAAHPLTKVVLDGRPEETEHDLRDRLLGAVAALRPAWVISVDADERFAPDDAEALRQLVAWEASASEAYGFTVYRMTDDGDHYDRVGPWVVRLFPWKDGQRFRAVGMEGAMVPGDIPSSDWIRTTIRMQQHPSHLDGQRCCEQGPERYPFGYPRDTDWQAPYQPPRKPGGVRPWTPRRAQRLLVPDTTRSAAEPADTVANDGAVVLSAIVISQNDEDIIERCVRSVVEQSCPEAFEVIVVTSGSDRTAEIVRQQFPEVTVVELPRPALPGEARNAGLDVARGEYVSFPGSHVMLPPGSLAARIRAHDLGFSMVTGSILNGAESRAGWASYFLDHFLSLPGQASRRLRFAPSHCSYTHEALLEVGGFPEERRTGEDTEVNRRLFLVGHAAYRSAELTLMHRSPCETAWQLSRHHFKRGVGYSAILVESVHQGRQKVDGALIHRLAIAYVPARLRGIHTSVRNEPALQEAYRQARPLIVLGAISAWAGIWYELLRSSRGRTGALAGLLWRAFRRVSPKG